MRKRGARLDPGRTGRLRERRTARQTVPPGPFVLRDLWKGGQVSWRQDPPPTPLYRLCTSLRGSDVCLANNPLLGGGTCGINAEKLVLRMED